MIGCGEMAAASLLPEIIASFHEKYPQVTYDIFTANADLVKEQMRQGLIDIGILLEPIDIEKFDFLRLEHQERWVLLMRPDDPLSPEIHSDSVFAWKRNQPLTPAVERFVKEIKCFLTTSAENSNAFEA
ncbi:MAG: LysR family transcriptional regulator substrate-binding protein [Lachnospiraceae bacterium]|nr:LysR family transcriptional regulator substrate-binding protein [Lachnospiraceae bacterium]